MGSPAARRPPAGRPLFARAARRAFSRAAAIALAVAVASPALAAPPEIKPLLLGELDLRLHGADRIEGENGFAAARLRLGVSAEITPWFRALAQAEWARDKPALLDAYAELRPLAGWAVRLGASKTPLFTSARDEAVFVLPVPERTMTVLAFWPGRDLGAEIHKLPTDAMPLEGWLRVGNGSGAVLGNDNSDFAVDARLDVALGRARPGADSSQLFGLRLGTGLHLDSVEDRPGITGATADGFTFYRPPTVTGPRRIAEAHVVVLAGPVKLTAEAAIAHESRSKDTDGNPETARIPLPEVESRGASVEVAWMLTGQRRTPGSWPVSTPWNRWDWGALEIAGRLERLELARGAVDVTPGGATAGAAAVRWWATSFAALSAAFYGYAWDVPPIEEPGRKDTWMGLVRLSMRTP